MRKKLRLPLLPEKETHTIKNKIFLKSTTLRKLLQTKRQLRRRET
jgi:hypothetical protein